jgi:ABC-type polysaccharide/polyol phosphate transport system ATPase subunit
MPGTPYIDVKDLRVSYPLRRVLKIGAEPAALHVDALTEINFRLNEGDRLGLLGRNGSGKSTLLKTLAGIYPPSAGQVEIGGSIASIFNASLGFIPHATGYENIFLRGTVLGMDFAQVESLVPYILEFSELADWIHQPVANYSSGMALRLAFSITTAVRCDILLLDEWLGAGDAQFLTKARARMLELVEEAGILVLATHNLNLMASICTKVAVLDAGRLVDFGKAPDIIPEYQRRIRKAKAAQVA